jgi:hypothetical protein
MSFWRRAGVLFGVVTTSIPLWPYIRKILEWGEHGEFILHRVHDIAGIGPMLEAILTPALWQPLVLTPFGLVVLWLALRRGGKKIERDALTTKDAVQIEFRWKPGGANDPFEINAVVTAKQNIKNLALIGHFAVAKHYETNTKWIWEPSTRLLKLDDIFKGEVKAIPIIRCPRNDGAGDSMMIFNERTWGTKEESQLLLFRVTAISDTGEQHVQKAYHARRIGGTNLLDPIDLTEIGYVEGAKNPVVTQIANDRSLQQSSLDRIPTTELLKMATDRGWNFTSQHSLHLIDLQDAIRQGGLDGHLTVWGKLNRWPNAEQLMRKEVIEKIPTNHWREFRVHLFGALDNDNFRTYSWHVQPSSTAELRYIDLHVNRSEAAIWLDRDAATFKGQNTLDT